MSINHPPIVILDFDGVILPSTGAKLAISQEIQSNQYQWNQNELNKLQPIDLIRRLERVHTDKDWKMGYQIYQSFQDVLPKPFDRIRFLLNLQRSVRNAEFKYAEFFPYVIPTLKKLSQYAIIGICTNSERKRIIRWLSRYSISHLITAFTSRDDRKQYGVKPDPKILLYTLIKIKHNKNMNSRLDKSRIYFVGDNVSDILTAKNAGVKSVAVLSGHSTKEELLEARPDFLIPTIEEIFSIPDLSRNSS